MTCAQPTQSTLAPLDTRARVERQLQVLDRLVEAGLAIVTAIERQATGGEDAPQVVEGDIALAFGRVSRAVRMAVALQSEVIKALQAVEKGDALGVTKRGYDVQRQVKRIVGDVIAAGHDNPCEIRSLALQVGERLERDDIYGELGARPVSEVVAQICRDLGLSPDWARLATQAWAEEELLGGAVGAPLAAYAPARPGPPTAEVVQLPPRAASP